MARPFLSEAQILEQRNRLIAAALALYRARGYEAVTLRELASQVGMSHFTPYRYFKSKDEMFAAIRTEVYTRFAQHLENAAADTTATAKQPLDRLRNICLAVVDFAWQFPEDYRLIFSLRQPPVADYPQLQDVRLRSVNFVVSVCQQAIDAGQLEGDAKTWAHVAWSSIHGLLSLHVANLLVVGRDLDSLVDPLLHALLPGAATHSVKRPRLVRTPPSSGNAKTVRRQHEK